MDLDLLIEELKVEATILNNFIKDKMERKLMIQIITKKLDKLGV